MIQFVKWHIFLNIIIKSDKDRTPSWCDRILYKSDSLPIKEINFKCHFEVKKSDHRPIVGSYECYLHTKKIQEPFNESGIIQNFTRRVRRNSARGY